MRNYGYFRSMLMSFYSRDVYRDVAANWGGGVLWYLFLVLAIYTAITTLAIQIYTNTSLPPLLEKFAPQTPEVIIKAGIVSTPENRPYLIIDPETKKTVAIIDASGTYTNLEHHEAEVLLTKDALIIWDNQTIKEHKLSTTINADLKPEELKVMIVHGAHWAWAVLFPIILIATYLFRIVQAFFYAILGKILSLIMSIKINYFDVFKLSVVALTPAIVLRLLIIFTLGAPPFTWLFCFLVAMGYLVFAISSVRK